MKFADYIEIIKDAVAHGGYDYFHRSLCEPSHGAKLHVLDGGLLPDGDERIAKEWAANFAEKGKVLYLAYRAGERRVDVCEITDHNMTDKVHIVVNPYGGQ